MKKIIASIYQADQDFDLIQDGDKICVGVSGGKDSILLLYALSQYKNNAERIANKHFDVLGIHLQMGFDGMDFSEVDAFMKKNDIEFIHYPTNIYEILKLNPDNHGNIQCSLCSKLKKGAIVQAAKENNCTKTAFAHHADDAVETLFMNMIYGGRINTFKPAMYLSNQKMHFIRPFVYCFESDIISACESAQLPIVKSTCPNDGFTKRQDTKELLQQIYQTYPNAKKNFLKSLTNIEQLNIWVKGNDWQHFD